jgi:alpha-1,2-mannosyltransferase
MGGQSVIHGLPLYGALTQAHLPFTYPPVSALFAVPLAVMPWLFDQWIWMLAMCASLVVCIRLAYRPLLTDMGRYATLAGAALFVLFIYIEPIRDELHFGQVDIILLALCVADCLAEEPRWPRGALIGLATAIKLIPGVFIVYLLITRRPAARTAILSALGWTALGFAILPGDSVGYWRHDVFDLNRVGSSFSTSNQSLYGLMLHVSGHSALPLALWLGVALLVAAAGFGCAWQVSRGGNEIAAVAIVALLGTLLSPISWIHEYVVIVVAIGAVLGSGRSWLRASAAAGTALLFTLPIPYWAADWANVRGSPGTLAELVRTNYTLAALLIIGLLWRLEAGTTGTAVRREPAQECSHATAARPPTGARAQDRAATAATRPATPGGRRAGAS